MEVNEEPILPTKHTPEDLVGEIVKKEDGMKRDPTPESQVLLTFLENTYPKFTQYTKKEKAAITGLIASAIVSLSAGVYFELAAKGDATLPYQIESLMDNVDLGKVTMSKVQALSIACFILSALVGLSAVSYMHKKNKSCTSYDSLTHEVEKEKLANARNN